MPARLRMPLALLAILLLSVVGCTYSTQPLSDAKSSMPDLRLLGTWEIADPDKPADKKIVVVDRRQDEPNVLRLFDIKEKKTADVFLTKIGNRYVASIAGEENGTTRFLICRYELKDESSLSLWGLDKEFFTTAVNDKRLKGVIKSEQFFTDVTIDETPEKLFKFIEEHAAKGFSHEEPLVIKRMRSN